MLCVIWAGSRMCWRARARVIVAKVTLRGPVGTPEGVFSHSGGKARAPNWEKDCWLFNSNHLQEMVELKEADAFVVGPHHHSNSCRGLGDYLCKVIWGG